MDKAVQFSPLSLINPKGKLPENFMASISFIPYVGLMQIKDAKALREKLEEANIQKDAKRSNMGSISGIMPRV